MPPAEDKSKPAIPTPQPTPVASGGEEQMMGGEMYMKQYMEGMNGTLATIQGLLEQLCMKMNAGNGEAPPEANPGSVAMQARKTLNKFQEKKMQKKLDALEKRLALFENNRSVSVHDDRLKSICHNNPSLDYNALSTQLKNFSDDKSKKAFLDVMQSMSPSRSHPANEFAKNFEIKEGSSFQKQFQGEHPEITKVAVQAAQDYHDTITQPNERAAKQFAATWSSQESYVKAMVTMEKSNPGHYRKMRGA